jgi:hypothetical protein
VNFLNRLRGWWLANTKEKDYLKLAEKTLILYHNNIALNNALGQSYVQLQSIRQEALQTFSAIVMQHGGELCIQSEFLEAIKEDKDATLLIDKKEDGSLSMKLQFSKKEEAQTNELQ